MWTDGESRFPDVPANHWFYEGLARARYNGILLGSPDPLGRPRPESRYSAAFKFLLAIKGYEDYANRLLEDGEAIAKLSPDYAGSNSRISAYRSDWEYFPLLEKNLAFFRRAEVEFYPQIREFRLSRPTVLQLIRTVNHVRALGPSFPGKRYQEFPDVPRDDWAAEAVRDLRALGLLDGYPNQAFRG
jgi:hypothetical protein